MVKNVMPDGAWDNGDPFVFNIGDLWIDIQDLPTIPFDREIPYFNQMDYWETTHACTIVNARRQFCYTAGHPFTTEEMLRVVNYCIERGGYVIGKWRWTDQAMKYVMKYIEEFMPEYNVIYWVYNAVSQDIASLLWKNHAIGFTYKGNAQWDIDKKDWELEWKSYYPISYGHRTILKFNKAFIVDDSFSFKSYVIKYRKDLVDNANIYSNVYLRVMKTTQNTETIKKYTKRKIMLQTNLENIDIMLKDPRRKTTDKVFEKELKRHRILVKEKLDFILWELKRIGL